MRTLLFIIGLIFMPFFWLGFLTGGYISIIDLYKDFFIYYKGDEPFGIFDQ
jgi:hypothetical protein